MNGYRADLKAILAVFETMPDYQQSLVISELQRTLEHNLDVNSEPTVTPVPEAPRPEITPKPKPKPKPVDRSGESAVGELE